MKKYLIVCSGRVNRYGYRIIPDGIRLLNFGKNPVLLYEHDQRKLPIGKLSDVKLHEGMLIAYPEFDIDDPVGKECARKFEAGYLNACSMGHVPFETSDDVSLMHPGQTRNTVTDCDLLEVSMTAIPGDAYAVGLTLSGTSGGDIESIPQIKLNNNKNMDKQILSALGLDETSQVSDAVEAIKTLKLNAEASKKEKIDTLMKLGLEKGVIDDNNKEAYEKLAYTDYASTETLITNAATKTIELPKKENLSIAESIRKQQESVQKMGKENLTFEKLQKENPQELYRIQQEEPELYKTLALNYANNYKN